MSIYSLFDTCCLRHSGSLCRVVLITIPYLNGKISDSGNVHGRALDSDLSKRYTTYGPPTCIPSAFPLPVLSYVVLFLLVMDGESCLTELHIPSSYQS